MQSNQTKFTQLITQLWYNEMDISHSNYAHHIYVHDNSGKPLTKYYMEIDLENRLFSISMDVTSSDANHVTNDIESSSLKQVAVSSQHRLHVKSALTHPKEDNGKSKQLTHKKKKNHRKNVR